MDQPTRRLDPPDDAADADDADSGATQRLGSTPPPPRTSGPICPKCQGATLDVQVNIPSGRIVIKRLDVLIGWFGGSTGLKARVCKTCGYVEFYATSLED